MRFAWIRRPVSRASASWLTRLALAAKREYLDRDGNLVSTELFDAAGFITHYAGQRSYPQGQPAWKRDGSTTVAEWFYERGVPVRYRRGAASVVKEGERWIAKR